MFLQKLRDVCIAERGEDIALPCHFHVSAGVVVDGCQNPLQNIFIVGEEHPYCKALIEAHKACLRVEGFNVSEILCYTGTRGPDGCVLIYVIPPVIPQS